LNEVQETSRPLSTQDFRECDVTCDDINMTSSDDAPNKQPDVWFSGVGPDCVTDWKEWQKCAEAVEESEDYEFSNDSETTTDDSSTSGAVKIRTVCPPL